MQAMYGPRKIGKCYYYERTAFEVSQMDDFQQRIQTDALLIKIKSFRYTYRCSKSSDWGDRLPVKILDYDDEQEISVSNEDVIDKGDT